MGYYEINIIKGGGLGIKLLGPGKFLQKLIMGWGDDYSALDSIEAIFNNESIELLTSRVATRPGNPGCPGIVLEFFFVSWKMSWN